MEKLVLNSVLIATFAIPALLQHRTEDGDRDYTLVLKPVAWFVAVYVVLLLFVYPRLL
jgi:hypothetical protein